MMDSSLLPSFDDWLRRARPRLLRLAQSRLRDRGEAEDVVQETALAVWKRHAAGAVDDLDAYANRAVWQNAIRRKQRRRDWEDIEAAEYSGAARVEAEADAWIEAEELEEAIAGLPAAQQAVVRLRFYAGLSFKEMGEALSIGLNTAASRTRYALQALRKGLGAEHEDGSGHPDMEVEHAREPEPRAKLRAAKRAGRSPFRGRPGGAGRGV